MTEYEMEDADAEFNARFDDARERYSGFIGPGEGEEDFAFYSPEELEAIERKETEDASR